MSAYARFSLLPSGGANANRRKKQNKSRRPASTKAATSTSFSKPLSRSSEPAKQSRISFRGDLLDNRTGQEVVVPTATGKENQYPLAAEFEPPMSQLTEGSYETQYTNSQEQNQQQFFLQQQQQQQQKQKPAAQEQLHWNHQSQQTSQTSGSAQSMNNGFQDVLPLGQRSVATSASVSRNSSSSTTHSSRGFLQARRDMMMMNSSHHESHASVHPEQQQQQQQKNDMQPPARQYRASASHGPSMALPNELRGQGPPAVYHREQQQQQQQHPSQAPMQVPLQRPPSSQESMQSRSHDPMQQQHVLDENGMQAHCQYDRPGGAPTRGVAQASMQQYYEQGATLARDHRDESNRPYQPQGENPLLRTPRHATTTGGNKSSFPSSSLLTVKRKTTVSSLSSVRTASSSNQRATAAAATPGRGGGLASKLTDTPGRLKQMLHNVFLEYQTQLEAKMQEGSKALDEKIQDGTTELTKTVQEGSTALDSKINDGTRKMDDLLQQGSKQQEEREEHLDSKCMQMDAVVQEVQEGHRSIVDLIKSAPNTLVQEVLPILKEKVSSLIQSMVGSLSFSSGPSSASKTAKVRKTPPLDRNKDSNKRPKKKAKSEVTPSPTTEAPSNALTVFSEKQGSTVQVRRSKRLQIEADQPNYKESSAAPSNAMALEPKFDTVKTPPPSRKTASKKSDKSTVSARSTKKHRKTSQKGPRKSSTNIVTSSGSSSIYRRGTSPSLKIRFRIPKGLSSPAIITKPHSSAQPTKIRFQTNNGLPSPAIINTPRSDSFVTPTLKKSINKKTSGGSSKGSSKTRRIYGRNKKKATWKIEDINDDQFIFRF